MPIRKQHEFPTEAGWPPGKPRFSGPVIQEWHTRYMEDRGARYGTPDGVRPEAVELDPPSWRGSYSSKRCDRALYYGMLGIEESNPPSLADNYTFMLGETIHEIMQENVQRVWEGAQIEVATDLRPIGVHGSMSIDIVVPFGNGEELVVEAKSRNGFGFKRQTTTFNGPPEGPDDSHVIQMAMGVKAREKATAGAVVYWTLEKLSPDMAGKQANGDIGRVAAEWWFDREAAVAIADAETERIAMVREDVLVESPSPRFLHRPTHRAPLAEITNPNNGAWRVMVGDEVVDHGTTWHCGYCPFRTTCISDGPGTRLL